MPDTIDNNKNKPLKNSQFKADDFDKEKDIPGKTSEQSSNNKEQSSANNDAVKEQKESD